MNHITSKLCIAFAALTLAGCGTSTINDAIQRGDKPLTVNEIYSLANDNTLRLVSSDFDAYVFLAENGKLMAKSLEDIRDKGIWDIKNNATLCLKFNTWYFGDVKCYAVYKETDRNSYLFFTNNGAFAYTATKTNGNSQNLQTTSAKKDNEFVREALSKGGSSTQSVSRSTTPDPVTVAPEISSIGPAASSEEIRNTVKNLAQDCPDCNLAGADLRQAYLVGANLQGANLQGADLSRANLRRANLEGADLAGATLLSTNLPGANLKNADLSGADLTGSNLIQADFTGADLQNAILKDTLQEGTKGIR